MRYGFLQIMGRYSMIIFRSEPYFGPQTFANNLWCSKSPFMRNIWRVMWNFMNCWPMCVVPSPALHGVCQHWWTWKLVFSVDVGVHGGCLNAFTRNSVQCHYNVVNFIQFSDDKYRIDCLLERGMGCLLLVWSLIHVLLLSQQCYV